MVALAILMPIVASMGGNAGTQTCRWRRDQARETSYPTLEREFLLWQQATVWRL
jgi:hypothetical protein